MFQTEIRVPFVQSHLWLYKFQAFAVVFPLWNWFMQMVNAIQGRYFPVLNFAYYFPKLRTSRFAYDGKQPIEDLQLSTYLPGCTFAHFLYLHFHFQISKYLRDSPPFLALSRFEHNWAFFVRCKQIMTYSLKKECSKTEWMLFEVRDCESE